MQEQLDKIEAKVDKILEIQGEMKVVQAEQHVTLQEHMKRSEANEKAVEVLSADLKHTKNEDIALLRDQKVRIDLAVKIFVWLVGLAVTLGLGLKFIHL